MLSIIWAVGMPDVGGMFSSFTGMGSQIWLGMKIIFWGAILGGIGFALFWMFSYKDKIVILRPRYGEDKGKVIKRKDGITEYKFFRRMLFRKETIPPPPDDLAMIGSKGNRVFFCIKKGEGQYHFMKMPEKFKADMLPPEPPFNPGGKKKKVDVDKVYTEDDIKVIPSDMYNWLIWRAKATRQKIMKQTTWQQVAMPVAMAIFIVMVCITLIYLFKELPTSIAVSVTQTGQMIPGFT